MNSPATIVDKAQSVIDALSGYRFRFSTEGEFQEAIERVLQQEKIPYERERDLLEAGRIDFLVFGEVGLEIKIKGSPSSVAEQVIRYCTRPEVGIVILFTSKMTLAKLVPPKAHGKAIVVKGAWEGML